MKLVNGLDSMHILRMDRLEESMEMIVFICMIDVFFLNNYNIKYIFIDLYVE